MFYVFSVLPDSKTELGGSNQEASPSAGKTTGIVLVPCRPWHIIFFLLKAKPVTFKVQLFSGCTVSPNSNKTKVGGSNQEVSQSAGKKPG